MDELFESIREQAGREIWSKAVELARQDAVSGDRRSNEEIVLRVLDRTRGVSAVVTFWPEDGDWSKDCSCKADPCSHVAAAVIALKRSLEQGRELPTAKTAGGRLQYHFTRKDGFLLLERVIIQGDSKKLLNLSLKNADLGLSPTKEDIAIESLLGGEKRGKISFGAMQRIVPHLGACEVFLDESPVALQKEALGLTVVIRDEGLGIHVSGRRDPRILESFHNGLVLAADGLHPQIEMTLGPEDLRFLQQGRVVPLRDLERFASEVLPRWEREFPVENSARNLPQFVTAEAELDILLEPQGDRMLVLPGIVYGRPPVARIADGVFRPTGTQVPIRDHDRERLLKDQLWRKWGLELYSAKMFDAEKAIEFVQGLHAWEGQRRGKGSDMFRRRGSLQPKVAWKDGRLELEFNGNQGGSAKAADVLRSWTERRSLVPLLDGGFASLPLDWLQRYGARILDLLLAQDKQESLPKAALGQLIDLFEDLGEETPPDLAVFRRLQHCDWSALVCQLPKGMDVTLRPYQSQGVAWLQEMKRLELGALLADDMGLGKTVQSLASLEGKCLIIAPTSVLPNWARELQRFRPNLKVCLYHGPNRRWDDEASVYLSSYGLLRSDSETLDRAWDCIVLDEAQTIKNPESKVAIAATQLRGKFRLALSGTPVENRLEDLWSIFAFLNPGLLGSKKDFRERWSRPVEEGDSGAAERLRRIISPFIMRRLKKDVALELPPRIEKVIYSELWPEERELYEAVHAATRKDVLAKLEAGGSVIEALEALLRMRQACCHPALIPSQHAPHSSKLTLLVDRLGVALAEGHKALVFSQWTSLLDLLEPVLEMAAIPFLRLDGSTVDRQGVVDRFQDEEGPPVLIMSLKAGGVGLNLTRADHVFILDPWWNPAAADQAADRAHRIGQGNTVMIHPLVALDSVEEKIMELQNAKRALAAAAFGEGRGEAITREDIMDLLR